MSGIGSHTKPVRGATDEWLSPPSIVETLDEFDLDPCAPVSIPEGFRFASDVYDKHDDGLSMQWYGRVWVNPPYSTVAQWMRRLAQHGNGITLTFARTEVRWWFESVWPKCDAILFLKGRPHFHHSDGSRAKGNSGGPVCLIAYGEQNAEILKASGINGAFIEPRL